MELAAVFEAVPADINPNLIEWPFPKLHANCQIKFKWKYLPKKIYSNLSLNDQIFLILRILENEKKLSFLKLEHFKLIQIH